MYATPMVANAPVESGSGPIAWKTVTGVKRGQRPLIVWISDPVADAAVEHRTFDDPSVRLASRAFRTVRITPAAARADAFLAPFARYGSAMVVLSPDLTREKTTYGASLSATTALAALRVAAKADLGLDLDAAVARAQTLVAEEQTVEGLKAALVKSAPDDTLRAAELDRRLATIRAEEDLALHPAAPRLR